MKDLPDSVGAAAPPAVPPAADGLPVPRRYWAAATVWMTLAMAVLDGAIANVALPTIAREIGASPGNVVWVVNGYQLAITVLLIPLAALGDRVGYHRIYVPALALFTLGSVTAAFADSLTSLVAARVVQGFGAAGIMSMNAALVRATYPAAMLGRGMGYNALVLSTSAAIGPTVAALILSIATWQWLFLVNLPIGLAAIAMAVRSLPRVAGRGGAFDWTSAVLSSAMMGGVVFGAETVAREGAPGLPILAGGLLAGTLLVRREWRRPTPLVPLDLLRLPVFALSIATSIVSFAAQMLAFVTLPFLLQSVLGRSVFETGLLMTPWPFASGLAALVAGRLADRMPAGLLGGAGLAVMAFGLLLLSRIDAGTGALGVALPMAVCGLGFGFFQTPNNRAMINAAPRHRTGAAGGMLATARLLGQTAGAVSVAAVFHIAGVAAGPSLLLAAAIAAASAAVISVTRIRAERRADATAGAAPPMSD